MLEPLVWVDSGQWPFGRADLHHWGDLLDRFDGLYAAVVDELWGKETGVQAKPFRTEGKRLVCAMLGFTRSLLEYSSSRNLFNSYEHLKAFITSVDVQVLEAALELLSLPARKLEAQQNLRKIFQEIIGVEELAILGQVNHPAFIEFVRDQAAPGITVDVDEFRRMHQQRLAHSAEKEPLQQVRLVAMSIYLMFMATLDIELDSSLFASSPTAIGDIGRSLVANPTRTYPMRREAAVVGVLRAALKVHLKASEVVYALNLSAGHGPVASILRLIGEAVREQRDPAYHQFFVSAFLDFVTALALSPEADLALNQSGVVDEVVKCLGNCAPRHYKVVERLLTVMDLLLHRLSEGLDAFFAADGLHAVVQQIHVLVTRDGGPLTGDESALLCPHLRLLDRLLVTAGGDDRLRNLVEGNLFKGLRVIFEAPQRFSPEALSLAVSILSAFIHHEPTSLSFLQEQGVPQAFLTALQSSPIPAQADLLVRLPQAFSALCLNPLGVQQFAACNPVDKLLQLFLAEDYMKPLKYHMVASELGRNLDEFMRHQPEFRDPTIAGLVRVLARFPAVLQAQPCTLLAAAPEQPPAAPVPFRTVLEQNRKREPHPGVTLFDLFTITLEGILQSPSHSRAFVAAGGLEGLFRVYSSPGALPFDFCSRPESHSVSHLFRLLNENGDKEPEGGEADDDHAGLLLSAAWHHVIQCSTAIARDFLPHRERTTTEPFFFAHAPETENAVFQPMCSLLALLGLLADLYLQHSYTAARQSAAVLRGLCTAQGEAAMVFLSVLLGACVTESRLLERGGGIAAARVQAVMHLEKALADPAYAFPADLLVEPLDGPAMRNIRAVLYVTGKLPGLITAILGGVSRMLSTSPVGSSSRRAPAPDNLRQTASLLANALASNLRALTGSGPDAAVSMLSLASLLFFDESGSKMAVQVLPLTAFAQVGGLGDMVACIEAVPQLADSGALELLLVMLGRVTNAQTYKASTWDDLAAVGFASGLRAWVRLAASTCRRLWTGDVALGTGQLRLLLGVTTNLLVREDAGRAQLKPHELEFHQFMAAVLGGDAADPETAWLAQRPLAIMADVRARCGDPALAYDACLLLLHGVEHFDAPLVQALDARQLAILLNSHRKLELAALLLPDLARLAATVEAAAAPGSAALLAAQLVALVTAGPAGEHAAFLERMRAWLLARIAEDGFSIDDYDGLLTLAVALTRLPVPAAQVPGLLLAALNRALLCLETRDIRYRALLSKALLIARHLVEGPRLAELMEPELVAKHKAYTGLGTTLQAAVTQHEPLVLRDWDAFGRAFAAAFRPADGQVALAAEYTVERRRAMLEQLYRADEPASLVVGTLLDSFLALEQPPVFQSAAESLAAEADDHAASLHFTRMAHLLVLSELVAGYPACHTALLAHARFDELFTALFDRVVPCGDLAMAGAQAASSLFVSGPVWVDFLVTQVCVGAAVPGLPLPLDRMAGAVRRVLQPLHACLARPAADTDSSYARMSRVWCLSMTVYSMLNMRGQMHRQSEAAQQCVGRGMLEARFVPVLAGLLGSLKSDWPGHAMVSAKLVLNLEALAKTAKTLVRKTASPAALASALPAAEASEADSAAASSDSMDISLDGDSSDGQETVPPEEFGYAQESSSDDSMDLSEDDSMLGMDEEMSSDGAMLDFSDDDGLCSHEDGATSGSSVDSSYSTSAFGDEYEDGFDDESVHIIMQPNPRIAPAALGDAGAPDAFGDSATDYDDEMMLDDDDGLDEEDEGGDGSGGLRHHHGHHGRAGLDEYDEEEDSEDDEGDLLGLDSEDLSSASDDEEAHGGDSRAFVVHRRRGQGNAAFLDSLFTSGGDAAFSSLAARGGTSGDLYVSPLLGRDVDAPACLSTRQPDLALFLRPAPAPAASGLVAAPYKIPAVPPSGGAPPNPFRANREVLRTPNAVPTAKRWAQEARMLFAGADVHSVLVRPTVLRLAAQLKLDEAAEAPAPAPTPEPAPAKAVAVADAEGAEEARLQPIDELQAATPVAPEPVAEAAALPPEPQEWTDMGPDAEFLLALPFDMRTEVINQYLAEERRQAIDAAVPAGVPVAIRLDPAFLQRLPDDLRQEYVRLSTRDGERLNRRRTRPSQARGADDDAYELEMEELFPGMRRPLGGQPVELSLLPGASVTEFVGRLAQSLHSALNPAGGPPAVDRVQVRMRDPAGGSGFGRLLGLQQPLIASPSRGGAALLDGRLSPLPAATLGLDRTSLAILLRSYYEPTMTDKKTHHKLFTALCPMPLDAPGGLPSGSVREELIGMLILVLEQMPADLEALWETISALPGSVPVRRRRKEEGASVVILQRTLQLLHYLVSHDDATKHYFSRATATPWTIIRRTDRRGAPGHATGSLPATPTAGALKTTHEVRFPLVLLLACLEKPQFLQVGLLVEFLLSLLAMVTAPIPPPGAGRRAGEPPEVPAPFLHALVKALGASELTPKAFSHATAAIQHLARVEGLPGLLLAELSEAALRVAEHAAKDLARLAEHLVAARADDPAAAPPAMDEGLEDALKALSSPTSAQARLLRLLKMMLVLLDAKDVAQQHVRADLAKPVWQAGLLAVLPRVLEAVGAADPALLHVALGLLPSIEAYFLHMRLTRPENDGAEDARVIAFAEAHSKLLNAMIRTSPALLTTGSFHALTQTPRVLDFDNKRAYFRAQLHALKKGGGAAAAATINLNVRRAYIFEDSYTQLTGKTGDELRAAKLNVKFHGEEGVDAGGVTREWYSDLSRKMFNPDNGLFLPVAPPHNMALQPNRMSWVNGDHLQFFAFTGRVLGKAIADGRLLDVHFTRSFYKHMLGLPVDFKDLEAIDPDYHKSLQWILEHDITDVMDLTFSTDTDEFGVHRIVELKPGGADLPVTEANKAEYVRLVTEYRLTTAIRPQIDAVLIGLHAVVPPALLALFTEAELELLISGLPDIDIDDWRANTDYRPPYTIASPQIQWFWRAVRSFSPSERAKLVQFVTGTAKVPLEGWAALQGSSGRQRFTITRDFGSGTRLPSAHTCFNQLDLPAYEAYEEERDMLMKAITEGATGFGLV